MDKQGNIKIRVMKKVMQKENVINNMKIIRFKIRRYKNGYSQGVLVESGNEWNLININEVDYVLKKELSRLIDMAREKTGPFQKELIERYHKQYDEIKAKNQ